MVPHDTIKMLVDQWVNWLWIHRSSFGLEQREAGLFCGAKLSCIP